MEILLKFLNFVAPYGLHSYFVIFGILILCGFGLPMPEDIILITSGILASRGIIDYWTVNAVCMAGVLMGDGVIFFAGRYFGARIKSSPIFRRIMTPKNDVRVQEVFRKYGEKVIFVARFMPGLRTPIFLTSGIYQIEIWKFFSLDGFAALISVPVWIAVGHIFGANIEVLEKVTKRFQVGIYSTVAVLIVIFIVMAMLKKKNDKVTSQSLQSAEDPEQSNSIG